MSVATEMVAELDITDQDVTKIADMIDGEIASLVPEWRPGPGIEESPRFANENFCQNCASTRTSIGSFMDFLSNNPCCRDGCASMHGRFEEITFQADESENHLTEGASNTLNQSDCLHYQEIWGQQESRELTPVGSGRSNSDEEYEKFDQSMLGKDQKQIKMENEIQSSANKSIHYVTGSGSFCRLTSLNSDLSDSYENEIQQELRWLKAKHQMELGKLRDQQLGLVSKSSTSSNREHKTSNGFMLSSVLDSLKENSNQDLLKSFAYDKHFSPNLYAQINKSCSNSDAIRAQNCEAMKKSPRAEDMITAKSFYTGSFLPNSLHRTTSLPVDAVDV